MVFFLHQHYDAQKDSAKSKDIEEVVLTGYTKVKNRVFTGSALQVKLKDIKLDGVPDISRMLEGRVAGLNIQNVTGSFGAAPRINIRGGASITGNVQPLWVVDGAVYEDIVSLTLDQLVSGDAVTLISSAIAGLNPSDIEDIQVLKDASATSMYGARALNGVIVISTKSGRRNTPNKISYSFEQTYRNIPSYQDFDLLNSQETMSIYREMEKKGYFSMDKAYYGRRAGVYYQMYHALNSYNPNTGQFALENTEEARLNFLRQYEYANTDWFKHLFRITPTQNHTLSFSGGGKNTATYASIGFFNDAGWAITDEVKRLTANLKNTFYLSPKLKIDIAAQGNIRKQKAAGSFSQRKNTTIGSFERDFDINPFSYALNTSRTLRAKDAEGHLEFYRNNWAPFNILNEYQNNYMNINVLDLKIQTELEYKITPQLKGNFLAVARKAQTQSQHYIKENSNVVMAFRANENAKVAAENIYLFKDPDHPLAQPQSALPNGGIFNQTDNSLESYLVRTSLDYDYRWGSHDLKLFGFGELRYADRTTTPFQGYGIQYDRGNQIYTSPLIFQKLSLDNTDYFGLMMRRDRGVTFSTNATYAYQNKYVLNAVANYEGSNIAGKGSKTRWLPTWNVGAKWNIHKENFLQNTAWLNTLALRSSYGLTAKMNENAINSLAVFQSGITNRYDVKLRENELNILHLENRDLTWEKMYEWNIGVDLGLFNHRLNTTVDVYSRKSFDLIDLVRTSGIGGQYYKYANFGDMETQGIEWTLNTTNISTEHFQWKTNLSLSYYQQKITRLLNNPNTFDLVAGTGRGNVVGYARGALFSFDFKGLDAQGLPTFNFGDYPFQGTDAYQNISGADFADTNYSLSYLKYNGNIEPNFTGGFSNRFQYKNFDFSFFITFQAGNKIRLQPTYDAAYGDLNVFSKYYYDRWLNPGDEAKTNVPTIPSQDLIALIGKENIEKAYNTYNYSQLRVADGSFIRMKNISLGYTIPEKTSQSWGLSSLSFRFQVTNPFLIYSDKNLRGQDPEFYRVGGVSLPMTKQYSLSINLVF
ncbi:SusC/RagA family TonB-linked outer membrane protein [Riemerella columbina]|uniref:SusC/RagA family TonB-linked outer membrane protein n=1 Tax=Riemerella columbina TaxID=103810 RepID=UPI00266FCB07|nr:SusC/RagA family TonB-linked outer membrane protein [Riemerella columbina]WKS96090.1 SusC/RagA family TonB-linked outer membrane protein [Riemerella columbina]